MSSLTTEEGFQKEENNQPATVKVTKNGDCSNNNVPEAQARDWRFWMIFVALSITGLTSAAEATIISTALPTIVHNLDVGSNYAWVANSYFLTSMLVQPLFGQLADIWGRRWPMICSVIILIIGSAICGWATNGAMLIAGRTIQGIGSGGANMLVELIICDLVPLRERSKFMGIIMGTFTIGTTVGPILGGIIVQGSSWRARGILAKPPCRRRCPRLPCPFPSSPLHKRIHLPLQIRPIDWLGNLILHPSLISILLALTDAGTSLPAPPGESSSPSSSASQCTEPTVPNKLFKHRTSLAAYILTLIHVPTSVWAVYFFPLYFQSVLGSTPSRSGVQVLPTFMILLPFAITSGLVVTKIGRYRPMHLVGFAIMTLGFGLSTLLTSHSSTAEWVIYQGIITAGSGIIISSLLPAIQVSLEDSDAAASTALFSFTRSFGAIWGFSIPVAVFNTQFDKLFYRINDSTARGLLSGGKVYEYVSREFICSFEGQVREQIIGVYTDALKTVWQVGIDVAGVGFLVVFVEKEIRMRKELKSEYGLKGVKEKMADVAPPSTV